MIAISYRREDSLPVTGRLYDRLQAEFGKANVFMDFDSIPYGVDFRDHIKQMIDRSKVLVAVIGPDWVGKRRHRGGRRIDDPTDFVRLEIGYALERKLPIIPVLVSNTEMPQSEELPKDIEALAFRNGLRLDVGIDFHHHAERLSAAINRILTTSEPPKPAETDKHSPQIATPSETPIAPAESQPETVMAQPAPIAEMPSLTEVKTVPVERRQVEPTTTEKIKRPAIAASPPTKDRQAHRFIDLDAQINAVQTTFGKFGRGFANAASAAASGTGRVLKKIGNSTGNLLRDFFQRLRRRRKAIALAAILIVASACVGGAIYWGIRSGTLQLLLVQTTEFFKSRNVSGGDRSSPPPTGVVPGGRATPAQIGGALFIDSTPQGEAYEVIDANNKHHIGKTPETLEELPGGYAQVIFRREGFSDHTSSVWISAAEKPSVSWNFPEDYRLKPAAAPGPCATPASPLANAPTPPTSPTPGVTANTAAENGRVWQNQISDFVRQFVAVNQLQDANATVAFYAPSVDYFGSRGKDHAFILRDVQKYNVQWPARRDSIDGDIQVEQKVPNQQYRASFKLNLYAENTKSGDWSKGQVASTLDINIIDGVPKIATINQKKLQRPQNGRGKGPRPPDMEPPGPITPTKLTKVFIRKYGFSALLPQELFPDAEAKLADGATDHLTSLKGCATVGFSAPQENIRKVFDDCVNKFQAAADHRTIDYKVVKDTWFAVSGSSKTTGYYVKGVRHGDNVFVMELDYVGAVCRIPASMVARMSHAFNGTLDARTDGAPTNAAAGESENLAAIAPNNQSTNDASKKKLTKIYVKKYGFSVLVPAEIFPEAAKLTTGEETQLIATDGLTTLEFYDSNESLAKNYRSRIADSAEAQGRTIEYKTLKENWFVVSGKFGPDAKHATNMGFYTKAVKKSPKVIFMHLRYKEEDSLISDEVLTAMSRSFDGN
jgi:hypothetical protein